VSRLRILLWVAAYAALLCWSYIKLVVPRFKYQGFQLVAPHPAAVTVAIALSVALVFFLPRSFERPSSVVHWLLYLFVLLPSLLLPPFALQRSAADLITLSCSLAASFVVLVAMSRLPLIRRTARRPRPYVFWLVVVTLIVISYGAIGLEVGFHFHWVGISDIYSVRTQYKQAVGGDVLGNRGALASYLANWQITVVSPLLLAYGIWRRHVVLIVIAVVSEFAMYVTTGYKSALFAPLFVAGLVYVLRRRGRGAVVLARGVVFLTAAMLFVGLQVTSLTNVALSRLGINNGITTAYYFDFFSKNPITHWADSVFRGLYSYPYAAPYQVLISQVYAHSPGYWNGNIWADGFANFHYTGMFLAVLILGVFLWIYDGLAQDVDLVASATLIGVPTLVTLSNAPIQTSFLTGGLLIALLLLAVVPRGMFKTTKALRLPSADRAAVPSKVPRRYRAGA